MIAIAAITIATLTITWGCHDVGPVMLCVMFMICRQSWHWIFEQGTPNLHAISYTTHLYFYACQFKA